MQRGKLVLQTGGLLNGQVGRCSLLAQNGRGNNQLVQFEGGETLLRLSFLDQGANGAIDTSSPFFWAHAALLVFHVL